MARRGGAARRQHGPHSNQGRRAASTAQALLDAHMRSFIVNTALTMVKSIH